MHINYKNCQRLVLGALLVFGGLPFALPATAQEDPLLKIYRATPDKINNLVHTKLDVRFDYKKRYLYGKEWVTLKPHLNPTDSLRLDAKGMDIKTLAMVKNGKNVPLQYKYDSLTLAIQLDKVYKENEKYTLYISYTAKPDELKIEGGQAITDAKGLYFINPDSTEKGKPVQIWTQGELESSSAWFPTIDHTNQKTTQEISMTVPSKYVTLSNGRLTLQKKNTDGTRTDTWKMDLPHSPYLFMMAVGDFKIYKDKWRDKEVSYYLEPKYAPYAKDIFGFTPEAMEFYSKVLGVDYPWNKYAQIVVRDFVSGAMENTTATLHGSYVQGTKRELLDRYFDHGRSTIVHELFHHWFGDYVTAESWSNITVNESFANFSETLWAEHKYGQDTGDDHNYQAMMEYFANPENAKKDLVRFHYHAAIDVFDAVSYQKGGRILNMLRNYLGAPAFFKGMNIYLKTNAFKNGEAHQLRLAFEEASGKDLNWFFDQWYFNAGHPLLDIDYKWDEATKTQFVYLKQTQEARAFVLPMAVDIYSGGKKVRHQVTMRSKSDTLKFVLPSKPDLINVDGDKIILTQKTNHLTTENYLFQYANAPLYMDRLEAIEAAVKVQSDPAAQKILLAALNDKYYKLRLTTLQGIDVGNTPFITAALPAILQLAEKDENTLVKAAALKTLSKTQNAGQYLPLFQTALKNQSYAIQGAGLSSIGVLAPADALSAAKSLEKDSGGDLIPAILGVYAGAGTDTEWAYVNSNFKNLGAQEKFDLMKDYITFIIRLKNPQYAQEGITGVKDFAILFKKYGVAPQLIEALNYIKGEKQKSGDLATAKFTEEAIQQINVK